MYEPAAGGVVFEKTANMEYALDGKIYDVLENAPLVPLNIIVFPESVAVPSMLFPDRDLSVQEVTVVVESIVLLSDASSHNEHP